MTEHDIALDPMAGTLARAHAAAVEDPFPPAAPVVLEGVNRTLLALDLGNRTGWALRRRDGSIVHGTEVFTPRPNWTPGQRWQRFRAWLSGVVAQHQVHGIVFERVVFGHSSASAADVYGGYRALVEMLADQHGLTLDSVAVSTVKKHWTGSGRADKPAMLAEAKRRGFRADSDNSADALAILSWAVAQERAA